MKTKLFVGCVIGLAAAGAVAAYVLGAQERSTESSGGGGDQAQSVVQRCALPEGFTTSYAYRSQVEAAVQIQGMPQAAQTVTEAEATLALEVLGHTGRDAVVLAQLVAPSADLVKMHGPQLGAAFLLKIGPACDLKQFARAKATGLRTAQAQQAAMSDFFFKVPAALSEELKFENGTGLAQAVLAQTPGGVTRTIKGYAQSWRGQAPFQVTTSFAYVGLNAHWIESFESVEAISGGLLVSARSTLSLKREQTGVTPVDAAASRRETDYEWANLLAATVASAAPGPAGMGIPPGEQRYVEQMKNATMESAFAGLLQHVEAKTNVEEQWHEMAGFLNGHPTEVASFAEGLKQPDFPESAKAVSYMVLSKVSHTEARDALRELRRDAALPVGDRLRATLALVTRKDVDVEDARALRQDALASQTGDAQVDFLSRNTLLHLGVLGGTHKGDAEAYAVAREAVESQLTSAGDDPYSLSPALGAAGNLAEPALLPQLETYTRSANADVRARVPKALRGYAYAETEPLWVDWLRRETSPDVKEVMFDVIYHQLANAKRHAGPEVAAEAVRHLRMKPLVLARQSIIHLLGPLKSSSPEVKQLLMQQLAEEFRSQSGLYSQIANYLAPEEIELALASMPEFAHQYGVAGQARAAAALREFEANEAAAATAKQTSIVGME